MILPSAAAPPALAESRCCPPLTPDPTTTLRVLERFFYFDFF